MTDFVRTSFIAVLLMTAGPAFARAPAITSDPVLPRLPALLLEDPLLKGWPLPDRQGHGPLERARFLAGPWGMSRWDRDGWKGSNLQVLPPQGDEAQGAWHPEILWLRDGSDLQAPAALLSPPETPAWEWDGLPSVAPRCTRPAVRFVRFGAEHDRFPLVRCDGSIDAEAMDRLSVMARPVGVPRPSLPLPDEPDEAAEQGAWVPSIRLVHPRMLWLLQKVAEAFPRRSLYVVSGYRPGAHEGFHGKGRAIDLSVIDVPKEELYAACRKLPDVGCGYYPHHEFVHLDVRPPGAGHVYWIDDSRPGEPSHYVDAWPGVEGAGAAAWMNGGRSDPEGKADAAR